jgi:hypothetical protein
MLAVFLSHLIVLSFAQKDAAKYRERANEVRQEIWDAPDKDFKAKDIPADMNNESAVVLARSFEVINSAKLKLKLTLFGLGGARRISYRTTLHERVKIQDKAALEEYSSIEYKKKLDNSSSYGFSKIYNRLETYIGAKIIKADGKEVLVNTDEEVLTKDEKRNKEGKLAISDLQVGDILDYFIRVEEMQETGAEVQGPYTFVMATEYPTVSYKVRLQLDDRVGVEYISANNAPAFKESKTEDGDILLELHQKNLPKYQSTTWSSPFRQFPYLTLQYKFVTKQEDANSHFNRGEVKRGFLSDDLVKQFKNGIGYFGSMVNYTPLNNTYDYFGGKKKIKDLPQDTVAKVLFDAWRHNTFCSFGTEKINVSNDVNYSQANSLIGAINMSYFLRAIDIDHHIVLLCSRNGNSLKNVMNLGDFEGMIKLNIGGKTYWMSFNDITTKFNEIPTRYQGEDAITLHPEITKRSVEYYDSRTKVPVTTAEENVVMENIKVNFNPANIQQLQVDRSCALTGAMRGGEQKRLLLMEDMDKELAKNLNIKTFTEKLNDNKKSQKLAVEFTAAFEKEKGELKKYFKDEAQEQFDEEPKDLKGFEVNNSGLLRKDPAFLYRSTFSLDNFVKKAGNNYIVDAGRLIGKFNKLEDKERKRSIDVYMPCARTFSWDISFTIPAGYNVKGVEDLNKNLTNETGSFITTAKTDGIVLTITVKRIFNKNFEPAANWQKLVDLLDATYEFNNKKILLEKKK